MASRSISFEDVASESFFVWVFGNEADVLLFRRMVTTKGDVLQSEEVVVTRETFRLFIKAR